MTEFSEYDELSSSRLFYGLTNDGRYFFSNQSSYTHEFNINIDEDSSYEYDYYNYYKIYNSINLFVSIKNDPNKGSEYLFSINPYKMMVELYNFNNDYNNHYIWNFNQFFNLDEDLYMFPYETVLFELKKESSYIIAFIPKINVYEEIQSISFIKKFRFKSFDENTYEEIKSINYTNYLNNQIINVILLDDDSNTLVVLSYTEIEESEEPKNIYLNNAQNSIPKVQTRRNGDVVAVVPSSPSFKTYSYYKFTLKFYIRNLKFLSYIKDMELYNDLSRNFQGEELFFKSINIKNQYVIYVYLIYDNWLLFDLIELNYLNYANGRNTISPLFTWVYDTSNYYFDVYESLNDFIKLDENRLVFIYTTSYFNDYSIERRILDIQNSWKLCIIIIDLKQSSEYLTNNFYINLSAFAYNGYLLFASTGIMIDENDYFDDSTNYFSLFMVFGYANGTDTVVDISFYLKGNENFKQENNFTDPPFENFTIENNIFEYYVDNEILLVSIPKEILIFEIQQNEKFLLENNSNIYFDKQYDFKENKNLTKTSQYYYIDYQYIIKESFNNFEPRRISESSGNDNNEKIFYGRINRLKFKLCHDFCETCYELSSSNDNQKCLSCLPDYQYDYF